MSPPDQSTFHELPARPAKRTSPALIELKKVRREFPAGDEVVVALKDVSLTIEHGEMVAIVGSSGSGKSTLMNILGCLDRPTSGTYRVLGRDTRDMAPDDLAALRREGALTARAMVLVGDADQLPSVGPGMVWRRCVASISASFSSAIICCLT